MASHTGHSRPVDASAHLFGLCRAACLQIGHRTHRGNECRIRQSRQSLDSGSVFLTGVANFAGRNLSVSSTANSGLRMVKLSRIILTFSPFRAFAGLGAFSALGAAFGRRLFGALAGALLTVWLVAAFAVGSALLATSGLVSAVVMFKIFFCKTIYTVHIVVDFSSRLAMTFNPGSSTCLLKSRRSQAVGFFLLQGR